MAAVWQATIADESGNAQPGASVEVTVEAGGALATLYSDRDGAIPVSNPIQADEKGFVRFYVAGGAYRITATLNAFSRTWRHVAIGLLGELDTLPETHIRFGRTATEVDAGVTPVKYHYDPVPQDVRRWNAIDTGGATDSTGEIQAAFGALNGGAIKGGGVCVPGDANSQYNISASIVVPARASGDNHSRWYSVRGMGRGAPRIRALAGTENAPVIAAPGQDASTYSFYREFKDLYLSGGGIANRGIELFYNQHYKVENVFITEMDDGSSVRSAAGIRVFGAICSQFRDVKVHDGDGYGIYASSGSGNFFNANLVEGCSFLNLTADGCYFSGGVNGCAFIGNTFEKCGGYGMRLAGFGATSCFIAGNYFELNGAGDIYIGEEAAVDSLVFEGNYLNGYNGSAQSAFYTPIRIRFSNGCRIAHNKITVNAKSPSGYHVLDANISGGLVTDTVVEHNRVVALSPTTAPNQVYNLPGSWVNLRNALIDPVFAPLIPANMIKARWPYGGWSISTSGSGSIARSGTDIMGAPALWMNRPAGSACSVSQTFTIQAHFKGRFVVFAVPVTALAASAEIQVSITPNGTSPQATTIAESTLGVNERTIIYAMAYVPSDATAVTCAITLSTEGAQFIVGHPCLYVGAQQWYSSEGESFWRANAAPSTGTWSAGDIVFHSAPVSGAQMGWMCTAGGAPGTWAAMAKLA